MTPDSPVGGHMLLISDIKISTVGSVLSSIKALSALDIRCAGDLEEYWIAYIMITEVEKPVLEQQLKEVCEILERDYPKGYMLVIARFSQVAVTLLGDRTIELLLRSKGVGRPDPDTPKTPPPKYQIN